MDTNKISGTLLGMAIGDALAAPVEFLHDTDSIEAYFATHGFGGGTGTLRVTDDTQMALAVGEALMVAPTPYAPETLEPAIRTAFVEWSVSPDNTRAPGNTCMSACRRLAQGLPWRDSTVINSKGCGANMRVQPVGLLFAQTPETRAALAQFQAAMTHGHATALAASDLTAWTVHDLATGGDPVTLPARLLEYAQEQRTVYHADWLGGLYQQASASSPTDFVARGWTGFIARGWDENIALLPRLADAVKAGNRAADPCDATGEGWIAEEAFATGLLSFLLYVDEPVAALRRASVTKGDSDSLACFAGAFVGAYHGADALPQEWRDRIEYRDRLDTLAAFLERATNRT